MKKIIITTIAIVSCLTLGCLLYGPIKNSLNQSTVTDNLDKVKIITKGISSYHTTNKKYPESLQQLVDEKILKQEDIKLDHLNIYYMKGCKPGIPDQLTFFTSAYELDFGSSNNQAIVAYTGGRSEIIEKHDLEQLLAQEIQKLVSNL